MKKSLRNRTVNLKTLLALPIVAGLFLIVIRLPPPHLDPRAPASWGTRLLNASLCIPTWFVILGWICWLKNGEWKSILYWMLSVVCFAIYLAYWWMAEHSSSLDGPFRYDWSGAYGVVWPAMFLSGWFLFILDTRRITQNALDPSDRPLGTPL